MIALLTFGAARFAGGRAVRDATFEARSTLPLSAACLVANGVREALARSLARDIDVELLEPSLPNAAQRRVLLADAIVYRVRGRICDGFVIVRGADARRLVALAFGESERPEHDALSEIERATLERIVGGLVPLVQQPLRYARTDRARSGGACRGRRRDLLRGADVRHAARRRRIRADARSA